MFLLRTRIIALSCIFIAAASIVGTGCSLSTSNANTIVTSVYPVEFVVSRIVGDDFTVTNITPVGTEPHDLELTPSTTQTLLDAKLVFVIGEGFQPALEKTAKSRDGKTVEVFSKVVQDTSRDGIDPHFWLDPVLYEKAVNAITDELVSMNPSHKTQYEKRRDILLDDLFATHEQYEAAFKDCATNTFITSHDAFSRLAKRYGLNQEAIAGISPENEPSPERLAELAKIAKDKNVSVIFTEDLVSDKVARTLSKEAGVRTQILSPLEGLSKADINNGDDYFDVMEANKIKLMDAMVCHPGL